MQEITLIHLTFHCVIHSTAVTVWFSLFLITELSGLAISFDIALKRLRHSIYFSSGASEINLKVFSLFCATRNCSSVVQLLLFISTSQP